MEELEATFDIQETEPIEADFSIEPQKDIDALFEIDAQIKEHNQLCGRDEEDCHPIAAITGLEEELTGLHEEISQESYERETSDNFLQEEIDKVSVLANGYIHEQGVASAVWTVQHNLNKYPSVTVVDSADNEIVSEVEYLDKNTVRITMTGASKGRAYLN